MFQGETVLVRTWDSTATDDFNMPAPAWSEPVSVSNVLVGPGPRADLGFERPEGVRVVYNLHFPRDFDMSMRDAQVNVRGRWFKVIGDPQHYTPENVPGSWTMPVEVETVEG